MFDIAVIIINYNTSYYTLKCIKSVIEKTDSSVAYQIIVVDNNSNLDDYKNLKSNFPKDKNISLHRSNINTGFGGGNMHGVQFCKAHYLLFLNNDAFLLNNCLSILLTYLKANKDVALCTAQNYDENHKHVISFDHYKGLRRLLFGRSFLEKINPKKYPKRNQEYTKPIKVNWVNGAFMLFDTKAFSKVGGFDTTIFLYYEEMDICKRLSDFNYQITLVPDAKILHYQGKSTGMSKTISREGYISYLYVLKKNYSPLKYYTIRLYLFIALLLKPKKWFLLDIVLNPSNSKSLKHQQKKV